MKKLESPSHKDALCQVWIKLALCFLRRGFFNFLNVFSLFLNYLLLEKGGTLHLNKFESPSHKDALCQVWLKLAQWFWRRRWKCEKFTDRRTDGQTDRQTDGRRTTVIRKAHLSFQLRWAKKSKYNDIYRWLSMARTLISWSSRSLEVKLRSSFFSLYNKASLLLISRSSQSLELSPGSHNIHIIVFHSHSLEILIANTSWPIKCVINTHWAYRYLDKRSPGADMMC